MMKGGWNTQYSFFVLVTVDSDPKLMDRQVVVEENMIMPLFFYHSHSWIVPTCSRVIIEVELLLWLVAEMQW